MLCNLTVFFDLMFFYCKNKASAKVGSSQRVGAPPACMRYKKRTNLAIDPFYTLKRVEKKPNLSVELFIPFVAVGLWIQKRAQLTLSSFYTLKRVEKKDQSCD